MRPLAAALLMILSASSALSHSNGEPVFSTGAEVDGGQNCSRCHAQPSPVNTGGRIAINSNAYTPGVRQQLTVQLTDLQGLRWGFQITARLAGDPSKQAGSFTPTGAVRVLCAPSGEAPCNGALEFAAASGIGGAAGTRTFTVEWTPPGRDLGEVIIYAAGIAANNDNTAEGDRTYTAAVRVGTPGCQFTERPTLDRVANGASFQPGIAPLSLISIFGARFAAPGDTYQAKPGDLDSGRLPADLACVAVEIGGRRAPVFYTQYDQINAQAPDFSGSGPVQAVVILNPGGPNELRSDPVFAQTQRAAPAFLVFDPGVSVKGRNASQGNNILADPALIPGAVFARPGDIITLYGTGFGATSPSFGAGEFSTGIARLAGEVTVTIGGATLLPDDVLYAGLSPDLPGLYQFNLRVPATASSGDIPIAIRAEGFETPPATIPVRR